MKLREYDTPYTMGEILRTGGTLFSPFYKTEPVDWSKDITQGRAERDIDREWEASQQAREMFKNAPSAEEGYSQLDDFFKSEGDFTRSRAAEKLQYERHKEMDDEQLRNDLAELGKKNLPIEKYFEEAARLEARNSNPVGARALVPRQRLRQGKGPAEYMYFPEDPEDPDSKIQAVKKGSDKEAAARANRPHLYDEAQLPTLRRERDALRQSRQQPDSGPGFWESIGRFIGAVKDEPAAPARAQPAAPRRRRLVRVPRG